MEFCAHLSTKFSVNCDKSLDDCLHFPKLWKLGFTIFRFPNQSNVQTIFYESLGFDTLYEIYTTKKHNNHSKKAKVIISYINREAPKHSANRIKCIRRSKSKPAAAARANAIPCSFCNAVLRISSTLRSWILKSKSNKQYPYNKTKTWIDNSNH